MARKLTASGARDRWTPVMHFKGYGQAWCHIAGKNTTSRRHVTCSYCLVRLARQARTHKKCITCAQSKRLEDFYRQRRCVDGHLGKCKACTLAKRRATWVPHPIPNWLHRKYWLKRKYNLTPEGYAALLREQKNCCAICEKRIKKEGRNTHVDHDHTTKVVRGILCGPCNRALGIMQESVQALEAMIKYLKKHQKET